VWQPLYRRGEPRGSRQGVNPRREAKHLKEEGMQEEKATHTGGEGRR